ncbi:hypothetical protein [Halochromatium sp.]
MVTIQGRRCSPDRSLIERLLSEQPDWGRSRLSVALCEQWMLALTLIPSQMPELLHEALPQLSRIDDAGGRVRAGG